MCCPTPFRHPGGQGACPGKGEAERFRVVNQQNLAVNDRLNKVWSLFTPTVSLLTEIGLLVVSGPYLADVEAANHRRRADRLHRHRALSAAGSIR
jgi:hypothetical protein